MPPIVEQNPDVKEPKNEDPTANPSVSDDEIALMANKMLRDKDKEIANLKKEVNKMRLLSKGEEEEEEPLSREECIKRLSDNRTTNYEYAEAVIGLVDDELSKGNPNPLGRDGDAVYKFFKDVIEECDGDKSRFPAIYQARIGADDPAVTLAYNKRKNRN